MFLFDGCCRGDGGTLQHQKMGEMNQIDCEAGCDDDPDCVAVETNGWNDNPTAAGGPCYHFNWNGVAGTGIINGNCDTTGNQKCWQKPGNFQFRIYDLKHHVAEILQVQFF